MAKGPQYNLPFRRRREGRTNYGKRRKLVTSGMTRLVVRPSNKHIAAQLVRAQVDGDRILASAHSSQLKEFGWKAPCGNLPAAYLTGLLAGQRAKASGVSEAILDIGLHSKGPGSRLFAVAKGAVEAGLNVPHDEKAFTSKERVQGKHVVDYSKKTRFRHRSLQEDVLNVSKTEVETRRPVDPFRTGSSQNKRKNRGAC